MKEVLKVKKIKDENGEVLWQSTVNQGVISRLVAADALEDSAEYNQALSFEIERELWGNASILAERPSIKWGNYATGLAITGGVFTTGWILNQQQKTTTLLIKIYG